MNPPESAQDKTQPLAGPGRKAGQGRFTLERLLGCGAMGEVWLAFDERLQEQVALKFVPPAVQQDASALEGLRREARCSRRLTHPNIIRIHDFHEPSGEDPFVAMEYVEGKTLSELRWSEPQKCLGWEKLLPLVRQLCDALEYAHGEGVVHRDLKPANLMLDAKGRLKLADFGLATVIHESLSRASGHVVLGGTPAYMSPQQVKGQPPTVADDVYSLGVTLYELLTSHPPFYRGDIGYQAVNEAPPPMRERLAEFGVNNPIPRPVEQTVMACLEKDAACRPQSVREVLERLDAANRVLVADHKRPKRMMLAIACVCGLGLLAGTGLWWHKSQLGAKVIPSGQAREPGFQQIFNGQDLAGWSGDTNIWRVENGTLTGHIQGSPNWEQSFLEWRAAGLENFELRFKWKWESVNMMGRVSFRRPADLSLDDRGAYNITLHNYTRDNSYFLWSGIAELKPNERVVVDEHYHETRTGNVLPGYEGFWQLGDDRNWNESNLVVQGGHLLYKVNGRLVAEIQDGQWQSRPRGDRLALGVVKDEWHKEGALFRFKDVRLKRLPVTASDQ
jgi:serine/threonine protein kinase